MALAIKGGSSATLANVTASGAVQVDGSAVTQPVTLPPGVGVQLIDSGGTNKASISSLGALKIDGSAVTQPVSIAAPVAVTGTFFQATQPVSIAAAVAVTGSFFQATQPVSAVSLPLAANAAIETGGNLASIAGQLPAATAKGVQASSFGSVQQAKDAGRTAVTFSTVQAGVASVTAEALLSFNVMKGTTQTTAQTSYTVAAGKTLRIQVLRFKARFTTPSTTVTFANVQFNMRNAASIATTNLAFTVQIDCAANAATPDVIIPIPDGWEFPAGSVVAFSQLGSATTLTLSFEMKGYEY